MLRSRECGLCCGSDKGDCANTQVFYAHANGWPMGSSADFTLMLEMPLAEKYPATRKGGKDQHRDLTITKQ